MCRRNSNGATSGASETVGFLLNKPVEACFAGMKPFTKRI